MARVIDRVAFVFCCLVAFRVNEAFAQDDSKGDRIDTDGRIENTAAAETSARARALELFEQSSAHYQRRDFQGTVQLLKDAYALFPEPVLLYNLARAYEGLGDKADAANAYQRYLAAEPGARDHAILEKRVLALREQVVTEERARAVETPPRQTKSWASIGAAPLVLGGIGIGSLGIGTVLEVLGQKRHRDAVRQPDAAAAQAQQRQAEDLVLASNIGIIGGALLTGTGAAWALVVLATPAKPPERAGLELRLALASATIISHF
jgi:tetratricopeptide (TPR) repeat protein